MNNPKKDDKSEQRAPTIELQLGNPAAAYCLSLGGHLIEHRDELGSCSVCHLPDGPALEQWDLYWCDHLSDSNENTQAVTA